MQESRLFKKQFFILGTFAVLAGSSFFMFQNFTVDHPQCQLPEQYADALERESLEGSLILGRWRITPRLVAISEGTSFQGTYFGSFQDYTIIRPSVSSRPAERFYHLFYDREDHCLGVILDADVAGKSNELSENDVVVINSSNPKRQGDVR
jgi:hypothetical protein